MSEHTSTPPHPPLCVDFSGLRLEVRGLTPELYRFASHDWSPFVTAPGGAAFLIVESYVREAIDPAATFDPKSMTADVEADRARFEMGGGIAEISRGGSICVSLARGPVEWQFYTFANLLCAGLAWRLPDRGGVMLHGAGVVIDDRAFLLVGPEGSGKTTWAALAKSGGAIVLSDDLVLVEGADSHPEVLSTPFRDDHPVGAGPGRWPLALILFPERGERARLEDVSRLLAASRLSANLPFVADGLRRYPRPLTIVQQLIDHVPLRTLAFTRDPAFVELLRAFPGG